MEHLKWAVKEINEYYGIDLSAEMAISVREYVTKNIAKLCGITPPQGIFYLVKVGDTAIGMGGLRRIRERVAEIKRMYIVPSYRRKGYGKALLKKLIQKAKDFDYQMIFLDTGPFMTSAQNLYRSFGFVEQKEYPETEVPNQVRSKWLYMKKTLQYQ
jgi:GNAT superfamily N-acetyltransferase